MSCCDKEVNLGTAPSANPPGEMTYCRKCGRTWRYPGPLYDGPGPNKAIGDKPGPKGGTE